MSIIIGIDPGAKGGLAIIGFGDMTGAKPMPCLGKEIDWHCIGVLLRAWCVDQFGPASAYVEKAHAMPGQGVTSMFKFGMAYGGILALLEHIGIETHIITPQAWKKMVLAGTAKDKAAAIAYCHRRWPKLSLLATPKSRVAHDGMADALCIAAYGEMAEKETAKRWPEHTGTPLEDFEESLKSVEAGSKETWKAWRRRGETQQK